MYTYGRRNKSAPFENPPEREVILCERCECRQRPRFPKLLTNKKRTYFDVVVIRTHQIKYCTVNIYIYL